MSIINVATFIPETEENGRVRGTVEVTLKGETRRVAATKWSTLNMIVVHGVFSGRYVSGGKAWPASVTAYYTKGMESVSFGRDDRSGKFNKANALFWA
jgi:hypothetical protein